MKQTDRLNLDIIDNFKNESIEDTINGFSKNFEKINDTYSEPTNDIESISIGKTYKKTKIIYNSDPVSDGYIGWVNVREGIFAPTWKKSTKYKVHDLMRPNYRNGHIYKCIQEGTSAKEEPLFPTGTNSTINDLHKVTDWKPEHQYNKGDIVLPVNTYRSEVKTEVKVSNGSNSADEGTNGSDNNVGDIYYECVVSGVSGKQIPDWGTKIDSTFIDGSVTWLVHNIAKWEEAGYACNFRPFGKIV